MTQSLHETYRTGQFEVYDYERQSHLHYMVAFFKCYDVKIKVAHKTPDNLLVTTSSGCRRKYISLQLVLSAHFQGSALM